MNETIVAPATALVNQAISIIRLSGPDAYIIINKVFSVKVDKPSKNKIMFGYIKNDKQIIDQVLLMCFKNPHSFTGEDMIEINCHGGVFITKKIVDILVINGATLAQRGGFSKQAFLNGKMNLLQADSINNLIFSTNEVTASISINTVLGRNLKPILAIRKQILDLVANIEINIDYPEYDGIGDLQIQDLENTISGILPKIKKIIRLSKIGKIISNGINTVIVGKPNVGKSSFLNSLLNENKAIVSTIEGTTRDVIEGKINIDGITLNLLDTAGIRETQNEIEKQGITKTKQMIKKADIILLLIDITKPIEKADKELLELTKNNKRIILINKTDLNINKTDLSLFSDEQVIKISAKTRNISEFLNIIKKEFYNIDLIDKDNLVLMNTQYINVLTKILKVLNETYDNIILRMPVDIININLKEVWDLLGKLLGIEYQEDILDNIFKNYCLGK